MGLIQMSVTAVCVLPFLHSSFGVPSFLHSSFGVPSAVLGFFVHNLRFSFSILEFLFPKLDFLSLQNLSHFLSPRNERKILLLN